MKRLFQRIAATAKPQKQIDKPTVMHRRVEITLEREWVTQPGSESSEEVHDPIHERIHELIRNLGLPKPPSV